MKHIRSADLKFVPAGHEDPNNPGVWKKVLALYPDAPAGRIQMVNFAKIEPGKSSTLHYHTSMNEIFIVNKGTLIFSDGKSSFCANTGDMVVVEANEAHSISNTEESEATFFAIGLVIAEGGKTVF